LDHRRIGPYKITKVISPYAYEIDFPATLKHHRVQHVSLLDPADNNPLPGQHNPPPPPVIVDGEEEHYVEEILDARLHRRKLQYLVKFVGDDQTEWKAAEEVNELEAVDVSHQRYPEKQLCSKMADSVTFNNENIFIDSKERELKRKVYSVSNIME